MPKPLVRNSLPVEKFTLLRQTLLILEKTLIHRQLIDHFSVNTCSIVSDPTNSVTAIYTFKHISNSKSSSMESHQSRIIKMTDKDSGLLISCCIAD